MTGRGRAARKLPEPALRSALDDVSHQRIAGWAHDPSMPATPLALLVTANDVLVARVLADRLREDLRDSGIGDGRHSFDIALQGLPSDVRHVIAVRRETDGTHLAGSPVLLEPVGTFDAAFRAHVAAMFAAPSDDAGLAERLAFLSEQTTALLDRAAERRSNRAQREIQRQIKWRWNGITPAKAATAAQEKLAPRALFIDETVPVPARDGGSTAIISHMRSVQRLGFDVVFISADMGADKDGILEEASIPCCSAPWHGSVEEVLRREANSFDLVYLHRAAVAARYVALVHYYQPKARFIYSVADLHHVRFARQARQEQRPELMSLARQYQAAELRAAGAVHAVITHSSFEAALIRKHLPSANVHVIPWSVPVRQTQASMSDRRGVGFFGYFGHPPNVDAAQWLIDEIMPLVHADEPDLPAVIAGSLMPRFLRESRRGIEALGHVDTLEAILGRVRVTIAPMNFGAGIKAKVLESLAAGIPCICTPIAAEGLGLPAALDGLIAADAQGLAERIIRLHRDDRLYRRCRKAGLDYVASYLSESRIDTLMREATGIAVSLKEEDS